MAEFVGAAAIQAELIKRQFNYLCCFNTNIQNLKDEATKLGDAKVGVEGQVDAARRNTEVIVPRVTAWLDDVSEIQAKRREIETEILNMKSGCLAIKSRFSLSRKATKMVAAMKELQDDHGKFGQISHPAPHAPPAAMASISLGRTYELESRKHVEENIMATLRGKKVSMMGICGVGGVGKTTMAKKIMSRAMGEGLFDEIVMVVVSQKVDMLRIQQEMAELLGLRLEVGSLAARAHLLRARLMNATSLLIILDDLWKVVNLEELGIPDQRELKACTILLTSRDSDVFRAMNVEKTFKIETLSEREAWSLFKEIVGACADDQSLFPRAKEIVSKCKGLPVALETVGGALKYKTNTYIWEDALQQLRIPNPIDIPDFLAEVYKPLKLSYDFLESEHARSIFLLCCLFPEGHNISIFILSLYALRLGMIEGITTLQDARNIVHALVQMLISRFLLLDGINGSFAKMHDNVRDFGIFIAAKKGLIDPNLSWKSWPREESNDSIDCSWISLFDADKITLPDGSVFPNLRFLLINNRPYSKEFTLIDNFLESTRKLGVLSIGHCTMISQLPHTIIHLLTSLRTLILESCVSLEDISVVGELVSLEFLFCQDCGSIKELPVEIGRLDQLKLLHISDCASLQTIAAGVISRLIGLEELTLIRSFKKWEEGEYASLCELNSLSRLITLRIEIEDASLASKQIHLSLNFLVEFNIRIGNPTTSFHTSRRYGRELQLLLERDFIPGDWIHNLLGRTESLVLQGACSSKLVPLVQEFHSLKRLMLQNAKMTRLSDGTSTVFPVLECLCLKDIDDFEEIHNGPISSDSFKNLQEIILVSLPKLWNIVPPFCNLSSIHIAKCHSLRSLFPLAMAGDYLLRLERIRIRSCSMLEQVVLRNEEENGQSSRRMGKLQFLDLHDLPRFTSLYKELESIDFTFNSQKSRRTIAH